MPNPSRNRVKVIHNLYYPRTTEVVPPEVYQVARKKGTFFRRNETMTRKKSSGYHYFGTMMPIVAYSIYSCFSKFRNYSLYSNEKNLFYSTILNVIFLPALSDDCCSMPISSLSRGININQIANQLSQEQTAKTMIFRLIQRMKSVVC